MRKLIALCALGLLLAGCGDSPAPPTSIPALPATATLSSSNAGPSPATATMVPPLVPAFPTSTVAFSGAGQEAGTLPFLLSGGTYQVSWNEQPKGSGGTLPTWTLSATIHSPDGSNQHALFSVTVPAMGAQSGTALVRDIPAGTYVLDVTAPDMCSWTVSIHP